MAGQVDTDNQGSTTSAHRPETSSGYAHLAIFMTKTRHGMIRRFKDLSTQSLFYLDAELYKLRFELDQETATDSQYERNDERSNWHFHWRLLATSGQRPHVGDKRCEIWLKLRETLYENREHSCFAHLGENLFQPSSRSLTAPCVPREDAIHRHAKVASTPGPTGEQRSVLANIVGRDSFSDGSMQFLSRDLRGVEPEAYREVCLGDLALLDAADEDNDPLERFALNTILRLLRAFWGCEMVMSNRGLVQILLFRHELISAQRLIQQEDIESGLGGSLTILGSQVYQWERKTYSRTNTVIEAMFSTIVPIVSVVTLYTISLSISLGVGLMCVFSLVFCLALSTLTKTRRIEVSAATAA